MLSKSLIQFSVDGRDYVPSLLFALSPKYGGGKEDNSDLLQKALLHSVPPACSRPCPIHVSTRHSWTHTGKSGSVSCGVATTGPLGPGAHKLLFVPSKSLFPQSFF